MKRGWRTAAAGLTAAVTGLGLAVVTNVGAAVAVPTNLFFSEYIEGSRNNKALEIYNGTGAAVNLGLRLQRPDVLQRQRRPPA